MSSGHLLISNAYQKDSRVLVYGPCDTAGKRAYERSVLLDGDTLNHPYGLALDKAGNLFVSNQDNGWVVRGRDSPMDSSALGPGRIGYSRSL